MSYACLLRWNVLTMHNSMLYCTQRNTSLSLGRSQLSAESLFPVHMLSLVSVRLQKEAKNWTGTILTCIYATKCVRASTPRLRCAVHASSQPHHQTTDQTQVESGRVLREESSPPTIPIVCMQFSSSAVTKPHQTASLRRSKVAWYNTVRLHSHVTPESY